MDAGPGGPGRQHPPHVGHRRVHPAAARRRGRPRHQGHARVLAGARRRARLGRLRRLRHRRDLQVDHAGRHRRLGRDLSRPSRRPHVERRQRVGPGPGELLQRGRTRRAAQRLHHLRQRCGRGHPRRRRPAPGHLDRRLDRRLAVLRGERPRPRPALGQRLRRRLRRPAGLDRRRLRPALHHHRDRSGRRVGGSRRRQRRTRGAERHREGGGVHAGMGLHHRPRGRRAGSDHVPLRHRGRLRRRVVQPHPRRQPAPVLLRGRRGLRRQPAGEHAAGDLVDGLGLGRPGRRR